MQDTYSSNNVSDPTLAKLLEADSTLATQEAELQAQAEAVREKRNSLRTVIDMFASTGALTSSGAKTAKVSSADKTAALKAAEEVVAAPAKAESAAPEAPAASEKPKRGTRTPRQQKAAKAPRAPKVSKKKQGWQHYVREEYRKTSLPEAVSGVLEREPNKVFSIPTVIDVVFEDDIPKEAWKQAQNRVSNILSTGVKDDKWHRGKTGHYSVSSESAMADLAS